jgi:gluconokinase
MIVVVMGVAGSGKTTVGGRLARELGWAFYDGDDFHPPSSIAKMRSGAPLTDADRLPWLRELSGVIERCLATGEDAVIACSALKGSYRRLLGADRPEVVLVYLRGGAGLIERRLAARQGHFMPPGLLESQLATLEEPAEALTLDASLEPAALVAAVRAHLGL